MLKNMTDIQVLKYDMGKWWDHYKCYVNNINDIIELLETEAPAISIIGDNKILFTAKDKLNRVFTYEYKGHIKNNSFGNIELFNLDLNESTIVELEWFNQREIKAVKGYYEFNYNTETNCLLLNTPDEKDYLDYKFYNPYTDNITIEQLTNDSKEMAEKHNIKAYAIDFSNI